MWHLTLFWHLGNFFILVGDPRASFTLVSIFLAPWSPLKRGEKGGSEIPTTHKLTILHSCYQRFFNFKWYKRLFLQLFSETIFSASHSPHKISRCELQHSFSFETWIRQVTLRSFKSQVFSSATKSQGSLLMGIMVIGIWNVGHF